MKLCKKCGTEKSLDQFYKNQTKKDGLQSICKACCNANSKAHYERNPQSYVQKSKLLHRANTEFIKRRKSQPCADCGESYPYYVMQFDHREDKLFDIANSTFRSSTLKLQREIDKCDVVCANCHAERTAIRAGYSTLTP